VCYVTLLCVFGGERCRADSAYERARTSRCTAGYRFCTTESKLARWAPPGVYRCSQFLSTLGYTLRTLVISLVLLATIVLPLRAAVHYPAFCIHVYTLVTTDYWQYCCILACTMSGRSSGCTHGKDEGSTSTSISTHVWGAYMELRRYIVYAATGALCHILLHSRTQAIFVRVQSLYIESLVRKSDRPL